MFSDVFASIWRVNLLSERILLPGILSSVDTWLGGGKTDMVFNPAIVLQASAGMPQSFDMD